MTSFTPGSTDTPPAEPTHSTACGKGDGGGEALADALGDGDVVAEALTDGAGLGDAEMVALGAALDVGLDAAAGSAVWGLLSRVSDDDGNEPVRAVNSAGEFSTVIGVDVGELVVDGDASGCAELVALGVGAAEGDSVDDEEGELDGVVEDVADGLGDSTTIVATHSGGISAGISHPVSSLAEASSFVDSSNSTGASSTTAESAVGSVASAAHAAGDPARTTTTDTNTERPARTRVGVERSLKVIGGCGSAV